MADIQSNIEINIDTSQALSSIKLLQSQISAFNLQMAKSGAAANVAAANMQQNLINSINQTGKFTAQMKTIKTTTESFTTALEKNQLSMREYFRYAGASTKTFGKLFKSEFDTITKVSRERVKDLQTQYIKMGRDANGAMKAISVRPLALDMESLATKTAMAAQKQALLNQLLRQGSTNLLNFGKNTQWAGRQLMVGFTVPLTMLGSVAAKTFMQLEEQAIRFKRVYGDMFTTTAETDKALKDIQLLAKEFTKYGVAVADTMQMAADVAATGKMGADLTAQVANATKLAVLGGIDQQKALDTVISLTSTFGIAAKDLTTSIDFLNAVENQTILNIDDLTTAIPKAAPVIKQLGGDVQDLAFFMTAMREGGIDAAQGANAIKSALASMINPTKAAKEMLASFGVDVVGIVNADKGNVKKMVLDLATALNTLDPLNRAQAIEKMFGKFQFARVSTLFQNVVKQGSQAQTVLGLTKATTEELAILSERELSKVENTTTYKFKKTMENLKVAIAPIGEQFLKAITPIAEFISKILDKFNGLGDGTKKFVVILTALLAGIGPLFLMTFGLIANGVANIIKLFVGVKSVFNKTGTASTELGAQTQYMTSQQIEAAAVASSLDQVHSKLTQTFSSEVGAVNQLVAAYERAVAAQARFSGPVAGVGKRPPMKFASGVVSVPGPKGAGDVVPAMLSPGESVIPAPMSKKYAPIISGMVSGNIPGYEGGRIGSGSEGRIGKSITTVMRPWGANVANTGGLVGFTSINPKNTADLTSIYTKQIIKESGVSAKAIITEIKRWETANRVAIDRATAAVSAGANATTTFAPLVEKFAVDMQQAEGPFAKFAATAKIMGPRLEKDLIEAQNAAMRLGLNMKSAADTALLAKTLPNNMVAQQMNTPGAFGGLSRIRAGASAFFGGARDIARAGIPRFMITPGLPPSNAAYKAATSQEHFSTTKKQEDAAEAARLKRKGQADAKAYSDGRKTVKTNDPYLDSRKRNSPHVLAAKDGADDARAYSRARNSQLATTTVPAGSQARNRMALYGVGPVDPEAKSIRRQLEKQQQAEARKQLALDRKISQSKQRLYGTTEQVTQDMRTQRRLAESQLRAVLAAQRRRAIEEEQAAISTRKNRIQEFLASRRKIKASDTSAASSGMGLTGGLMAASMVAMMGSSVGGPIGEISQKLVMPLMAFTMIAPMLKSSFGLLAAGIGVVVAAYVMNRMAVDKARDSALDFANKVNSSNDAIVEFGKFARRVSGTEIMDRRRADAIKQYQTVTGKTTFGESYVAGDAGKALVKTVGTNIAKNGSAQASQDLFRQLSMAVASGTLSTQEARSIALNVGDALGNQAFGIQVNGKLIELLGPNGENLIKDPMAIRIKMIEQTNTDLKSSNARARQTFGVTWGDTGNAVKNIGGGALAGATAGAIAGSMVPIIGTTIGAIAGGLVGSVAGYFNGRKNRGKRIAASTGADAAMQKIALENNQQMLDGLEVEYQKRIDIAKAAGDTAEADRLSNEYLDQKQRLLDQGAATSKQIMDNFDKVDVGIQEAYMNSADKLMTNKYKGTALEDVMPLVKQSIDNSAGTKQQQYLLKMEVASGNIDPIALMHLMDLAQNDKAAFNVQMDIITRFGGKTASEMQQVSDLFIGADGKVDTTLVKKFQIAVGAAKTTKEAQKIIDFNKQLTLAGGELDIAYLIKYYQEDSAAAQQAQALFDKVSSNSKNLSIDVVTRFLPAEYLGALDQNYYNTLTDNQKQVYLNEIITVMSIKDDVKFQADPDVQKWLTESKINGGGEEYALSSVPVQKQMYAQHLAGIKTKAMDATTSPITTGGTGGGTNRNPWAFLEDVVKQLRDTRDAAIDANKPLQVLQNLMSGKLKLDKFSGLADQFRSITKASIGTKGALETIANLNPNENLLSALEGLDPKDFKTIEKALFTKNKTGDITGFTKKGLAVNQMFDEAQIGKYTDSIAKQSVEVLNQQKAYMKLTAAGVEASQALEITGDAALAASIASENIKVGTKEWDDFIKSVQKAKDLLKTNEQFKIGKAIKAGDYTTAFSSGYDAIQKIFGIQEKLIQLNYQARRSTAENAVKSAQSQIDANNYAISKYQYGLDTINEKADAITQRYNDQFDALDKIRSINDTLIQQKQSQIDLASSLSRGDIASAAKAMEDLRQQRANAAIENARKAMENQRDAQIAALTDSNGLTKAQLEAKTKELSDQNKQIQYEIIDANNEQIRLIDERISKETAALTVVGKSKDAWDAIAIKVDASEIATGKFDTAIAGALSTSTALEQKWKDIAAAFDAYQKITAGVSAEQKAINGQSGTGPITPPVVPPPTTSTSTSASTVTVKSGNTLSGIAKAAGVSLSALIKANPQISNPNLIRPNQVINIPAIAKSEGGMVPSYFAAGGYGKGTDTIPAMLTPGEFVVKKYAVDNFGVDNLKSINNGTYNGNSVYNYNLSVNVGGSTSSADDIARTVMSEIRRNESQRIRGIK